MTKSSRKMSDAGCDEIFFGVETGSPRMQRTLKKKLKLDRAPEVVRKACELGILATCGFIVGFPQERMEDVAQTMRLMLELYFAGDRDLSRIASSPARSLSGQPAVPSNTGTPLPLTTICPIFPFTRPLRWIWNSSRNIPQVFSTLYHYIPEHVDREVFVRVTHLMLNLLHMRHTAFWLLRDVKLGFPESLLERIADLELPSDNIFSHLGDTQSLLAVSAFIRRVVNDTGIGSSSDPRFHEVRFGLAHSRHG